MVQIRSLQLKMIDWNKTFKEASQSETNGNPSVMIQNCNPCPSQGSRNIFSDDQKMIGKAAKDNGFELQSKSNHSVHYIIKKTTPIQKELTWKEKVVWFFKWHIFIQKCKFPLYLQKIEIWFNSPIFKCEC